jgi:hypothetical protein
MKYLKTFEGREKPKNIYLREIDIKTLNAVDTAKVKSLVISFMNDKKIIESMDDLDLADFRDSQFEYFDIWSNFFTNRVYIGIYQFLKSFNIGSRVEVSNSLDDILSELYDEYNINNKLDRQLINIFEKKPTKYPRIFDAFGDDFTKCVKDECEWMLSPETYNL